MQLVELFDGVCDGPEPRLFLLLIIVRRSAEHTCICAEYVRGWGPEWYTYGVSVLVLEYFLET